MNKIYRNEKRLCKISTKSIILRIEESEKGLYNQIKLTKRENDRDGKADL